MFPKSKSDTLFIFPPFSHREILLQRDFLKQYLPMWKKGKINKVSLFSLLVTWIIQQSTTLLLLSRKNLQGKLVLELIIWVQKICVVHIQILRKFSTYSCNKIKSTWIQISHQNWNGFFSNISHRMIIYKFQCFLDQKASGKNNEKLRNWI